jgi:hypothetical protein
MRLLTCGAGREEQVQCRPCFRCINYRHQADASQSRGPGVTETHVRAAEVFQPFLAGTAPFSTRRRRSSLQRVLRALRLAIAKDYAWHGKRAFHHKIIDFNSS